MTFLSVDPDTISVFNNDLSHEKILIVTKVGCSPCDRLKNTLVEASDAGVFYGCSIYTLDASTMKKAELEELGVRHFPTMFYFIDGKCVGVRRGWLSEIIKEPVKEFLKWVKSKKSKARKVA